MTHHDCSLCCSVPDSCWEEYSSDTLISPPLPVAIQKFVPFGGLSGLICCPECLTFYQRASDRFNVANGPLESSIAVTRLSDAAAEAAIVESEARSLKRKR